MAEQTSSTMRSLDRSLDVLDALQRGQGPLRLSDIAHSTGLTLPTVSRILATLQSRGYVAAEGRRFRVGPSVLAAAHSFLVNDRLVGGARPYLQELAAATGLTCSLYERVGFDRVLVARVDGARPLRYELPIGRRLPLHLGAGKAISVDFDAEELDALAEHLDRFPDVSGVPLDRGELERDLETLRRNGFHVSVSERAAGVMALSVPVRTPAGELLGALSLAGPAEGQSVEELRARAGEVARTAFAIGESFSRGL
ncbi:IclR family transcriptional regulator [Kineococcus rhizosphaerae]|uniref:Glycerol operon regulatory protein n=1 Tax=Kineococcus rhizosphaerae TaxID=559628 RepID=A0A2T0QXT1_9ACTN|nr:IclR family transcriptional regulator [Kineococcus rhizosphaerae]PRY10835.1 IclR family transcriptional regulator [Kineococcus rhizosphaerae]